MITPATMNEELKNPITFAAVCQFLSPHREGSWRHSEDKKQHTRSLAFTALLPNKVEPSLGLTPPTYKEDPTIFPGQTVIKKAHIAEMRSNIKAVE